MPKQDFQLNVAGTVGIAQMKPGDIICTIETPDGIPIDKAVNALASGLATAADQKTPAVAPAQ